MRAWLSLLLLIAALAGGAARADTPLALLKTYSGKVNFTGTQKSLTSFNNGCGKVRTSVKANITGIPATATILSARLYWTTSGSDVTTAITFEDAVVSASTTYSTTLASTGFSYVGAAADVTAKVQAKRNGNYSFAGLVVDNGKPYCKTANAAFGAYALLVIYSDASESNRVLNVYEGFTPLQNASVNTTMNNFVVPSGSYSARVGYLAYLGDSDVTGSESFKLNGVEVGDGSSIFNSNSNIDHGNEGSANVDFDAFTAASSVLSAGQTSAPIVLQTGADQIILNALIAAIPNVQYADLAIDKTLNGSLFVGQNATYTLTVSNLAGGDTDPGPIVVVDTLPTEMNFVSASGTGWVCSAVGKTLTCNYSGSLASGASLPVITVTANVTSAGTLTNTATVSGTAVDKVSSNNTDSVTETTGSASSYTFTDSVCVSGLAFGAAGQTCKELSAMVAGSTSVFVTALNSGVPTRLSSTVDTTVSMAFAMSCYNPTTDAGVAATYAGQSLALCAANRATPTSWTSAVPMVFKANAASSLSYSTFVYNDVGQIQLFLNYASGTIAKSASFVSRPAYLGLAVTRTSDGFVNPEVGTATGYGFIGVGEAFTMKVTAYATGGAVTKNFGKETVPVSIDMVPSLPAGFDDSATYNVPNLSGSFNAASGGVIAGTNFTVDDLGSISIWPSVNYLGTGIAKTPAAVNIGRFYVHHFNTSVAANMSCLTRMGCATGVSGAAYSAQPFNVTIEAVSASDGTLPNFHDNLWRDITLEAYDSKGGTSKNPGAGVLSPTGITKANVADSTFVATHSSFSGAVKYTLPGGFSNTAPQATWTLPTSAFIRAKIFEFAKNGPDTGATASTFIISSSRGSATKEGGLGIVNGRLLVPNVHGAETLSMPVQAAAQYYTVAGTFGSRWETSSSDSVSTLLTSGVTFSNCKKNMVSACSLSVVSPSTLTLSNGLATFYFAAPGLGKDGSIDYQLGNPAWLPSTIGRATFGVYKSPVIYVRELY